MCAAPAAAAAAGKGCRSAAAAAAGKGCSSAAAAAVVTVVRTRPRLGAAHFSIPAAAAAAIPAAAAAAAAAVAVLGDGCELPSAVRASPSLSG